ncbi:MAG: metallophosphoesterase [Bacteroidetes bacterium]|jgi:serine/threonine protein phosphatase 1|nr:metallophosphoesterase [Bacteroidota bacterium]MBU1579322.1 metallophosphoesterase [Bacteroidota bacterium]MBU2466071.1 metallophosphoesterase [Bacteroidota bacterium]MBU2556286.1 metallophosphoesterase [Bacteroidota bacterium]MDA3941948.1 metallophosphoesterase [Bacteroidota bacterium]
MMNKRWVIPDIHGCAKTLRALVENMIKPGKFDTLYFLGDYIDRGPDSKAVLDYLMELEEQEFQVKFLLGNHEDYCIKAWDEDRSKKSFFGIKRKMKIQSIWEIHGGKETLESFGATYAGEIPEKYINWMRKLKYYIELDDFVLVHAGLNFKIDDPFTDKEAMIWTREFSVVPEKIRNRKVVHGHVPVDLEFMHHVIQSKAYKFIDLDNGVYIENRVGYGNLIGYELNEGTQLIQTNIDL